MTVSSDRNPVTLDQFIIGVFVVARLGGRRSFRVDRDALVTGMRAAADILDQSETEAGVCPPAELVSSQDCQDAVVDAVMRAVEQDTLAFDPTAQGDGRLRVALSAQECDLIGDQVPGGLDVWTPMVTAFARVFAETAPHERPGGAGAHRDTAGRAQTGPAGPAGGRGSSRATTGTSRRSGPGAVTPGAATARAVPPIAGGHAADITT